MGEIKQNHLMFIGAYAETDEIGISTYALNSETGEPTLLDELEGFKNPTFIDIDHKEMRAYSISQVTEQTSGETKGVAVALSFDQSGKLSKMNEQITEAGGLCHVQYHDDAKCVFITSYHGGEVVALPIDQTGKLMEPSDVARATGELGPNSARQDRPHPHSAIVSPNGEYIFVPDLGTDQIHVYRLNVSTYRLNKVGSIPTAAGAGPRHMKFHPTLQVAYVINELNNTITAYEYTDEAPDQLQEIQTISTLPASFSGENTTAEIRITSDGKKLFGSNRGHNSLASFEIDPQSGRLTLKEIVSTEGEIPRNFSVTPDGKWVVIANQDTNNLVIKKVDSAGNLTDTGYRIERKKPVCVQFWQEI